MYIILDNGHGKETGGKRSPLWKDGTQLFEWKYNREIVDGIITELNKLGINCIKLVPEDIDVSLGERCHRVNKYCKQYGTNNCLVISVHVNAGGGTGWEIHTSPGETKSDKYAKVFIKLATNRWGADWRIRGNGTDFDSNFYILKHTNCPAVLTENFFMDNKKDCDYLLSVEGKSNIINFHIDAIQEIIKNSN